MFISARVDSHSLSHVLPEETIQTLEWPSEYLYLCLVSSQRINSFLTSWSGKDMQFAAGNETKAEEGDERGNQLKEWKATTL